jgi:hypothetical protein
VNEYIDNINSSIERQDHCLIATLLLFPKRAKRIIVPGQQKPSVVNSVPKSPNRLGDLIMKNLDPITFFKLLIQVYLPDCVI